MAGNSSRRGAVRNSSKKGPQVGSGGQRRRGLEGKGPTPKAAERPNHKAYDKSAANKRATNRSTTGRKKASTEMIAGRNSVVEALRTQVPITTMYIANRIDSNIRELEGALTRVVAYASLIKKPVTTDVVAEALKDVFPNNHKKEVTLEVIQEIVATYFKIRIEDLHSKKRTRSIAFPRQIAMYLCRELTDTSLPQIGNFFGGRDHTTVLHAYDKIAKEREENAKLHKIIKDLIESIQKM